MDRFVAFVWDPQRGDLGDQVSRWIAEVKSKSAAWTDVFTQPGLAVVALKPSPATVSVVALDGDAGVVVGTLFSSGAEQAGPVVRLKREPSSRIVASGGRELISQYWGSYVAFIRDARASLLHVIRDPCGPVSCFVTHADGIDILCAFVDDIADLSGIKLAVDWESVGAFFVSNHQINDRTGLLDLAELLPGQRMTWSPTKQRERSWVWNPVEIAAAPNRQSYADARDAFRSTTERCVAAWTSSCDSILVRMSGGLDSSVVAGLVGRMRSGSVSGVHFVGRGYESFELGLAREAAISSGIPLVERNFDTDALSFRGAAIGPRVARPTKQLLGSDSDAILVAVCEAAGTDCVMSGHGGDAIFLQRSIAGDALTDYLRLNGAGRDALNVAYNTATMLELSIWQILKDALSKVIGRRRWDPDTLLTGGRSSPHQPLTREALRSLPRAVFASAWLDEARSLPNGKAEQVRSLLALRNYHPVRGHALSCRAVHPLISQPLIELSLRTPTYVFCYGGSDRALERDAFADIIPKSVARRLNKGFINHSANASLVQDFVYIRDLVLNGGCMKQGILDRKTVEELLTPEHLLQGKGLGSVMDLVAVESWLAAWRR